MRDMLLVLLLALVGSMLGALTRPPGAFALFWPANALLLGLFVRKPELANTGGWIAATLGFFVADLFTKNDWLVTFWLTSANVLSIATGFLLFLLLAPGERRLRRPMALVYMVGISAAAAAAGAIASAGSTPAVLNQSASTGFMLWFSNEMLNFVVILPLVLSAPSLYRLWRSVRHPRKIAWHRLPQALPALSLLLLALAGTMVDTPMAMTLLPVPALLWCGYRYRVSTTALLALIYSSWQMIHVWEDTLIALTQYADVTQLIIVRSGLTLIALLPIIVAVHQRHSNETRQKRGQSALLDPLTQVYTRDAFLAKGEAYLTHLARLKLSAAVGVIDIDQMKAFNQATDRTTGDAALCAVSRLVRLRLRQNDLTGRTGDDEFAFVVAYLGDEDAQRLADRLCDSVADSDQGEHAARLTISLGMLHTNQVLQGGLENWLATARKALQRAKDNGGNCAVLVHAGGQDSTPAPSSLAAPEGQALIR